MARKTNNSSQSLTNAAAQALAIGSIRDNGRLRRPSRKLNKSSHTPIHVKKDSINQKSSSNDESGADAQADEDEGVEAKAEEEEGEPAAFAPSVRATIESAGQAGLLTGDMEKYTDASTIKQSFEFTTEERSESGMLRQGSQADDSDDDYAAVNEMSDSSGSEAGAEAGAEQDIVQEEMDRPSSGHPSWDDPFDGMFGTGKTYFEQLSEPDFTGISSLAGDYTDYQDWEGIPDTPVEVSAPTLGRATVPSSRRVHFELRTSNHAPWEDSEYELTDGGLHPDRTDPSRMTSRERHGLGNAAGTFEDSLDDGCSSSGYETDDGGTTDEEEPPVLARGLFKAPHLLRRSSLSSLDTTPTSYVYTPASSDKPFKIPSTPASHRRKGPRLGTFQTSKSRSYAIMNPTGDTLLVRPATRPSPLSTPRHSRVGSFTSNSAPQTPITSQATLAAAPDLSETEFSDAAASMAPLDPVLSIGPDFVASAGFSHATPPPSFPQMNFSSGPGLHWCFPMNTDFRIPESDEQAQDNIPDSEYEDMIAEVIDYPDDSSSEDEVSVVSASSLVTDSFDVQPSTLIAQPESPTASPTSASSIVEMDLLNGLGTTARRNGNSQRLLSDTAANRPSHGLRLKESALAGTRPICLSPPPRKRKLSESHGSESLPILASKRRLLSSHC